MSMRQLTMTVCHAQPADLPGTGFAGYFLIRLIAHLADDDGIYAGTTQTLADRRADISVAEVETTIGRLTELNALRRLDDGRLQLLPLAPGCECDSCTRGVDCYCWEAGER